MEQEKNFEAPVEITIQNLTGENQAIRYYSCNFQQVLAPEDEIILVADTSEKAAYYTKLKELLAESTSASGDPEYPADFAKIIFDYLNAETKFKVTSYAEDPEYAGGIAYIYVSASDPSASYQVTLNQDGETGEVVGSSTDFGITIAANGEVTEFHENQN